ncbi:MAG: adenylosuccinate lyase [Candidatus Mesenet longicola]|uniref:Adenylosuccinate lyase n=1 Tax=Candidatus Mesenet longicola TaxID=1892558 RepID=A0A8J3MMA6_9RICK|nr:MAG: adenylosuccinate lyase [Candidatus Mesenet longicola]GHM59734.1 MAG: adenylosuccinate lyase [Candidatus Mesenet longicola]
MIPRYSRKEISSIWEDDYKFKVWLKIERLACQAQEELKVIPKGVAEKLSLEYFDIARIHEIEVDTKHDVIAFLTYVAEKVGVDIRYMHYGMTSSDILDTCLAVQLKRSSDILLEHLKNLLNVLKKKAEDTKDIICVGRSHGVHAEPMIFGLKFARFYAEFKRNYERLKNAQKEISTCKVSGAVGSFTHIDPYVEGYVAKALELNPESIASQVIPRDRHAMFFSTLAIIAGSIENVAVEIRNLQKTEVMEVSESFSIKQKGSSAMPHKRNPILSENLTGLSRLIRSYVMPALENIALWHERDISHSAVERCIAPDACIAMDFALTRLINLIENLIIYPENIKRNLNSLNGLVFSQRVLLELINTGLSREKAYKIVQQNAMKVWENKSHFLEVLKEDSELLEIITLEKLESLFDFTYYTKHIDYIYNQVFTEN